ncbi:MAG: thioredoxin domain-containing protein [Prevotellaceae bacterium]|jgi:uncharacterized protein YyaL (SSP411 family)|nr:thioredoxin domain-containing protein [Prevotellaceae bacterium]
MEEHNRLINENSLYLRDHAHQKIDWYPWCVEAFEKARKENKLVFISIGFSVCHWCHELSRNCFENEEIVQMLNSCYVCVIVDREERPDVDLFYMSVIEIITNSGGWPVSCFTLPNGFPVYGGTYFTPEQFLEIIQELRQKYLNEYDKLVEVGQELMSIVRDTNTVRKKRIEKITINDAKQIIEPWRRKFDRLNGGTMGAPKFPLPLSLMFLEYSGYYLRDKSLTDHVEKTLDKIVTGGIYDHLGGGFFRYAEDMEWRKPHFEKMLSDNAMLTVAYCYAYRNNPKPLYKKIIEETVAFLNRAFYDGNLFCGSLDAETENIDGNYYVWSAREMREILGADFEFAADCFGISENRTKNTLFINKTPENLAEMYKLPLNECRKKIEKIKQKLYAVRKKREKPFVDTKKIAGWNSLVLGAFCEVYRSLGSKTVFEQAKRLAGNIIENYIRDDYRMLRIAETNMPAYLDDYVLTANAFIRLYKITGDKLYIDIIRGIINYAMEHFYDKKSGMFFFSEYPILPEIPRIMDFVDKTLPSSNALMAKVLTLISFIDNNKNCLDTALQMINNMKNQMSGAGPYVAYWSQLLYYNIFEPAVVFMPMEKIHTLGKKFIPNILLFPENSEVCNSRIENITPEKIAEIGDNDSLLYDFGVKILPLSLRKGKSKQS